jgi:cyclase
MQLFFQGSQESPGAVGIAALPGMIERIRTAMPLPQFGWNRVAGGGPLAAGGGIASGGGSAAWAYYANSYALSQPPKGWEAAWSRYGVPFVAALERGPMLLCQFHPELSGDWGLGLLGRWAERAKAGALRPREAKSAERAPCVSVPRVGSPDAIARRIIPCLDVDGGRVVKGTRFLELRDLGDPAELARRYEDQGADELCILDITAGSQGRATALETIRAVRAACGLPICAGGGVRSIDDAEALLLAGADKIAVNTRAYREPALVTGIARAFGSQACVVAIDATRDAAPGSLDGRARVALDAGRTVVDEGAASWAARAVGLGAGELLLTSRDRDGTGTGYDLELLAEVSAAAGGAPVIASGGASDPAAVAAGFGAGAGAALLAGALHRGELSIGEVKTYLRQSGVEVRL